MTGVIRHVWDRAPGEGTFKNPDLFWVRCDGCGSIVVTETKLFPDWCHDGWAIDEDCRETVVRDVMES